ncbi:MAG: hypothetical protein MJ221_02035 [Bacilli bacterium]|nr:hypothetical protein [Bacilli bacterium]
MNEVEKNTAKLEKEQRSRNRIFVLVVVICALLLAAFIYELTTLIH